MRSKKYFISFVLNISVVFFANSNTVFEENNAHKVIYDESSQQYEYDKDRIFEIVHSESYLLANLRSNTSIEVEGQAKTAVFVNSQLYQIADLPQVIQRVNSTKKSTLIQFFPLENEFKVSNVKTVVEKSKDNFVSRFTPLPRTELKNNSFSFIAVLLFLSLTLFAYFNPELLWGVLSLNDILFENTQDSENSAVFNSYILTLFSFFQSAFLAYIIVFYFSIDQTYTYFLKVTLFVFVFIQLKRVLNYVFCSIFEFKKWIKTYYFESSKFLLLNLLILALFLVFTEGSFSWINQLLAAFIGVFWCVKVWGKINRGGSISVLRIISYLCAAEIIPLVVVYSALLELFVTV
jgi:Domain of unknown function (DUF4271)